MLYWPKGQVPLHCQMQRDTKVGKKNLPSEEKSYPSFFVLIFYIFHTLYQSSIHAPWFYPHNKRPMGHIAHLRKQFKSINTYDYIITLIKRRKNNIIYFMRIFCFFIWRILNSPHQRMLCAKIGWNWRSGSGEENFWISSMYLHYFVIISPWKRAGPFNWTIMNPLSPEDALYQVWLKLACWFWRRRFLVFTIS